MAIDEILISAQPGETRIALVEEGHLRELVLAHADCAAIEGDIFMGRVERVVPSIQAAFVAIGVERAGFLALPEARPPGARPDGGDGIGDYVGEGDTVTVQVLRDPMDGKGAKLTTHLTIPGRYLVYLPGQPGLNVSRRIGDGAERDRLTAILQTLAGGDEGFIVRTAAEGASDGALAADAARLRTAWAAIVKRQKAAAPPARLHGEAQAVHRVLRDTGGLDIRRIVSDDGMALAGLRDFCAGLAAGLEKRVEHYAGPGSLFEDSGVEEQIEAALDPVVPLGGGGTIVIEETAALVAIDVNTGATAHPGGREETAFQTNMEAAEEIAHQVRLRGLAGLVVVDFVPMKGRDHGTRVVEALRRGVASDPCPTFVAGFTRLGVVEMTRRRRRESLSRMLSRACPACGGAGRVATPATVAFRCLRALERESRANPGAQLTLTAAPAVIEVLRHGAARGALDAALARLGAAPALSADGTLAPDAFRVAPAGAGGGPGHG